MQNQIVSSPVSWGFSGFSGDSNTSPVAVSDRILRSCFGLLASFLADCGETDLGRDFEPRDLCLIPDCHLHASLRFR